MKMSYWRFAGMIATSTVVMFGLMYLNTFALEHVLWSETRVWMAVVMGATMAVIMLAFMFAMYKNTYLNIAIFAGAIIAFATALWLVQSQATVNDADYMSAMIPHHSIAIMTSKRAQISDPRVRKLADEVISAQEREIAEMKYLIADLERRDDSEVADDELNPARAESNPQVVSASDALEGANVATLDPAKLDAAEITSALAADAYCEFRYTSESEPVFALASEASGESAAVVKLNGNLIVLRLASADGSLVYAAEDMRITLSAEQQDQGWGIDQNRANMMFEVGTQLRAGYGGYYRCRE